MFFNPPLESFLRGVVKLIGSFAVRAKTARHLALPLKDEIGND